MHSFILSGKLTDLYGNWRWEGTPRCLDNDTSWVVFLCYELERFERLEANLSVRAERRPFVLLMYSIDIHLAILGRRLRLIPLPIHYRLDFQSRTTGQVYL